MFPLPIPMVNFVSVSEHSPESQFKHPICSTHRLSLGIMSPPTGLLLQLTTSHNASHRKRAPHGPPQPLNSYSSFLWSRRWFPNLAQSFWTGSLGFWVGDPQFSDTSICIVTDIFTLVCANPNSLFFPWFVLDPSPQHTHTPVLCRNFSPQ